MNQEKSVKQKSDALKNFEANLDDIMAFLGQMKKGSAAAEKAAKRATKTVEKTKRLVGTEKLSTQDIEPILRSLDTVRKAVQKWTAFNVPASRWIVVMMVSYLEGYLEDVLIGIALKRSEIIKNVDIQTARVFEVDSIEELRAEVRRNWAHDELRPNGPIAWRKALKARGAASPITQATIDKMQHLWDTRNLIVHARSVADVPYAKKYAKQGARTGVAVKVSMKSLEVWLEAIAEFVDWADTLYLKIFESPVGTP
jgi:hypothetical protein